MGERWGQSAGGEEGGRGGGAAGQAKAEKGGLQRGNFRVLWKQESNFFLGVKHAQVSTWRNVVEKDRWWNRTSQAAKKKLDERKLKLCAVARSRKIARKKQD